MALFGNPNKKCIICGKNPGSDKHIVANDRFLCDKCAIACGYENMFFSVTPTNEFTEDRIKKDMQNHQERIKNNKEMYRSFKPTVKYDKTIYFDSTKLLFYTPQVILADTKVPLIYRYSQVISCEIFLTEGMSTRTITSTKTKGGLGRAVAGGLLFGVAGAVVGGTTASKKTTGTAYSSNMPVANELKIQITTNDISHPVILLTLLNCELRKSSKKFKQISSMADEIFNIFRTIAKNNQPDDTLIESNTPIETSHDSLSEEIRRYKALFDDGIITEEEFLEKKKQLLGL